MVDEMAALHSNGTWDLVVLPSGKSTVGCRWVYTVKVGPDGQVDRLKARLVTKGYTQVYGSDYGDTFSPVAKIASVPLLLSMAALLSWPLYQLDIKNVFLHGDLAEEVYMEQPPGFVVQGESGLVCSIADHSIFYHHNSSGQCIYLTKDLGKLKYFLGIEIAQSSFGVVLSQRKYALDILEEIGMLDCKPVDTPMDPNVKLIPGQGEPLGDPWRYHHWDAVIRILRYIKSTLGQGVLYENRGHTQSKKQDVVVRSSAEVEYRAMALATCELIWLKHLLRELRFGKDEQMKLIYDNQAALHIASNPVFHERTKHIEVDCHFIREKIASGCVVTRFVNSNDQLADIFTKSLSMKHLEVRTKIELQDALFTSQQENRDCVIEVESCIDSNAAFHSTLRKFACQAADHALNMLSKFSIPDFIFHGSFLCKIHGMEYSIYRIPLCAPPTSASVNYKTTTFYRDGFILILSLEGGHVGFGELKEKIIYLTLVTYCIYLNSITNI
ncbi:Retrovirus-related Pol polyprotein from transposon RE2 [Vitis vinifera]|uniref:Retrovirus-related Pol polyprotein from transposon RE2 n=1 Tax=Vitis vinifera TaxID=29760 RepID=A0A438JBF5_VITVI|nr:Retrovirus-related Pol polyprotein from transposon RE2 [Vitis vinifera]